MSSIKIELRQEDVAQIREICASFNKDPQELINVLHKCQEHFGYLPAEVQEVISEELNVPVAKIYGVITFYSFFSMTPKGKHPVSICMGTACYIRGAQGLLADVEETAQTTPGETSSNGQVSLLTARCLGSCGLAPNAVFDGEVVGKVTPSEVHKRVQGWLRE